MPPGVEPKTAKRRAEDCADSVRGVKHVQNNLRIPDRSGSQFRGGVSLAAGGRLGQVGLTLSAAPGRITGRGTL